jgi:REP element-mobilizing transposase RayT
VLQHVIARGIERRDIFLDDEDRFSFRDRLSHLLEKTSTRCFAWALMSNHFHLLLMPTTTPLSTLMRRLLTGYAVVFNRKYNRSGHLFQNRYKSIVCEEETYLLELTRYIHLNPVRAGLVPAVEELERYPWAGHSVLMGNLEFRGQATEEILLRFGNRLSNARQRYSKFIADGLPMGQRDEFVGGGLRRSQTQGRSKEGKESFDERILGSGDFVDRLRQEGFSSDSMQPKITLKELVLRVCDVYGLDLADVRRPSKLKVLAQARGVICCLALRELKCRGAEVGKYLHLGASGVSAALRRGEDMIAKTPDLKGWCLGS